MTFHIRFLDTDPHGRAGHVVPLVCSTREQAETIRRGCPNAEHMEVIERMTDHDPRRQKPTAEIETEPATTEEQADA